MTVLKKYQTPDGIELLINPDTGETFCSVSGYALLANKNKSSISRRLKGVAPNLIKNAEVLTASGLQGVKLISENLLTDWIIDDNPEVAKKLLKSSVRVFLHTLAGYKITSKPPEPLSMAEFLLQQAQMMVDTERQLKQISTVVNEIKQVQADAVASLEQQPSPSVTVQKNKIIKYS